MGNLTISFGSVSLLTSIAYHNCAFVAFIVFMTRFKLVLNYVDCAVEEYSVRFL
jgi:hypothetical protein